MSVSKSLTKGLIKVEFTLTETETGKLQQCSMTLLSRCTGRERLIRTQLFRSSTLFEVSVKSLPDSYHFMVKMHGQFKHS